MEKKSINSIPNKPVESLYSGLFWGEQGQIGERWKERPEAQGCPRIQDDFLKGEKTDLTEWPTIRGK